MKKQSLRRLIVGIAFSLLFVGVVGIILLRSARGIRLDQNTHNAVDDSAAIREQPDQAEGIILGKVPDQPIELVRVELVRQGDQRGDLFLEIENNPLPPSQTRFSLYPAALLRQKRRMPHKSLHNPFFEAKPFDE